MADNVHLFVGVPSELGLLWQAAIDRYKEATGNSYIIARRNTASITGVLAEIGKMQNLFSDKRHDGSKLARFRSLISNSLAPIQALSEIAAQASKAVFPPSEVIFAAVRFLIATANNVSGDYEKLMEFFQDVEAYLNGIEIWETQVPAVPQLKRAITAVFSSVLVLCGLYTRYISTKRVVKAFRSLMSGEDSELKDAHQDFQRAVQHGRDLVQNATFSAAEETKLNTQAVHVHVQKALYTMERLEQSIGSTTFDRTRMDLLLDAQERDNTLRWLSNLDFRERQRDTVAKHHRGTGEWLLKTTEFQHWVHGSHPSTLWCPGDPGTGKTVMMSAAICYVEDNTPSSDRAIAHVYCNYKESETQSVSGIWLGIIRQLTEQCDPFPSAVQVFRDRFINKRSHPTEDDLISLVSSLSGLFGKAFAFIDALDEFPEQNREKFIASAAKVASSIRLFLTSRRNVALDGRFSGLKRIDIVAHQDDIRAYLEYRLTTDARLRTLLAQDLDLRVAILKKLSEQANGMFLLAHLQMNNICNKRRPSDVRKALLTLAKDVHQFYDESLQRIEEAGDEDKEFALRVLSYVFCARRPLSKDELIHALSIDLGATDLASDALYSDVLVFSVSSGLIRIDEESNCVRLTHHTLHEHLQKFHERLLRDHEKHLATACLTYLLLEPLAAGPCSEAIDMAGRLTRYCLLEYACHHWAYHSANYMDDKMIELVLALLRSNNNLATCVQVLYLPRHRVGAWHKKFPQNFTCLHAAAYWGLDKIIEALIKTDPVVDIDCRDSSDMTPLLLSAKHGHTKMVMGLLAAGANVNLHNIRGETALTLAARHGHEAVVQLALKRGASYAVEDVEGWTALHWAIIGGHDNIVRRFLNTTFPHESDKRQHNKALILAAEAGDDKAVRMLLSEGADVDYNDDQGSTPLHWAVPEGHLEASKVLLVHGADPNSRDHYGNTAMHWTVPHPAVARLLVDYGAEVDATNDAGESTLLWSVLAGKSDAVEILIELGANVNGVDQYKFTALHAAALQGHDSIVRTLLQNGADANKLDTDGWTALEAAMLTERGTLVELLVGNTENGHDIATRVAKRLENNDMRALMEEMAARKSAGSTVVTGLRSAISSDHDLRLLALLENGADINAEDEMCGSTALTYAAWVGREKVVRLLLEYGADVDLRERSGRTALHWAAWSGYPDMVVDLVERGATIDLRVFGWTAMLLAARTWQCYIVLYLIEQGADVSAHDFHGRTALHWSCIHGDIYQTKRLIQLGADVDARDHCGQTALHWAIASGHCATADLLLRCNANAGLQASDGSTALHLAAYMGQLDAVALLLKANESQNRRRIGRELMEAAAANAGGLMRADREGFTALDMAELTGNLQVAQLLKRQYTSSDVLDDGGDFSPDKHLADIIGKRPTPTAPPLQHSTDEKHDYRSPHSFTEGLGRILIGPEARQWLRERQKGANHSLCLGSALELLKITGAVDIDGPESRII